MVPQDGLNSSSLSGTLFTNSEVVDALNLGLSMVVNSMPSMILTHAVTDSTPISNSTPYTINRDRVVSVRRDGIECMILPPDKLYVVSSAKTASSIYDGSRLFPAYIRSSNKIYITPTPTSTQTAVVSYIKAPVSTTSTTGTSLGDLDSIAVTYAAGVVCIKAGLKLGMDLVKAKKNSTALDSSSSVSSLTEIVSRIKGLSWNSTSIGLTNDAEYYISDEDPEMINAIASLISANQNTLALLQRDIERYSGNDNYVASYIQSGISYITLAREMIRDHVSNHEKTVALNIANNQGGQQ
jgi:hypothetical protein